MRQKQPKERRALMNSKHILSLLLLGASLTACTEVDICEKEHPHQAGLKFDFDWGTRTDKPERMGVLCYRVVDQWKQIAEVNTDDLTARLIGATSIVPPETPDGTDTPDSPETPDNDNLEILEILDNLDNLDNLDTPNDSETPDTPDDSETPDNPGDSETPDTPADNPLEFKASVDVPRGDYKFITFPLNNMYLDYSEIDEFINKPAAEYPLQDVGFSYKQYSVDDPNLNKPTEGWNDFNPYAKYIRPDVDAIFYDSTQIVHTNADVLTTQHFKPRSLTQNIDIYFTIKKDIKNVEFVIDDVWAELSGVPNHILLSKGYLDITKTSKVMFSTELTPSQKDADGNDTPSNKSIRCHGNIDVTGIVNVQRGYGESEADARKKIYGPGIMQVIIYSHIIDKTTGRKIPKKWQGIINLYRTLQKSNLMTVTTDGKYVRRNGEHGTININAEIVLDGVKFSNDDNGNDALDRWRSTEDINVDI